MLSSVRVFRYALGAGCLFVLAGCRHGTRPEDGLPPDDLRQAQAMAYYADGLLALAQTTNATVSPATRSFEEAVRLAPEASRPEEAVVDRLIDEGRIDEALVLLLRRLDQTPDDRALLQQLMEVSLRAEKWEIAAEGCRRGARCVPEKEQIFHIQELQCLVLAGRHAQALTRFRAFRGTDPLPPLLALLANAAVASANQNQPEAALRYLDPVLDPVLNGESADADLLTACRNLQIELLIKAGRTREARRRVTRLLEAAPDNRQLAYLANLAEPRPDLEAQLQRATQKNPPVWSAWTRLLLLSTTNTTDRFADYFRACAKHDRTPSDEAFAGYADLLDRTDHHAQAEQLLRNGLVHHPQSAVLMNALAYFWAETNRNLDEAEKLAEAALRNDPENAAFLDTRGWVLYKKGRYLDAIQLLLKAAEYLPDDPTILDHAGDALRQAGRPDEARQFWKRAHEFNPDLPGLAEKLGCATP